MYMTYAADVDAAYIGLIDNMRSHDMVTAIHHPDGINEWEINLDFDVKGRLVGIEVLFAKDGLPPEFISQCERLA
ncbi:MULTISPECIES: DUF2283 domain-containing protein [unclassified Actinobaculum]|uniref:DUF2283 domain-containing protein n=1 Tax=unclassified Actinobaculum TaxID=2609299 RepID=UPI000D529F93|nr:MULTISPECIES: DUF2283 domain-containing protein [unclassified Actinobaculum]AWE41822.1 hypothetical protein DDD63_02550 [Actinobaculum sp. 313]RTE50258.1 DUF2283 domain-containing protein [Actinobaculum sp. 352]